MLKKLPIDTYTFKSMMEDGYMYVDKTEIVYKLTHESKIAFLSRPRRFGKSMLCHTLKEYFSGNKEMFQGLKIYDLEKDWVKHPVFFFTMSMLKDCSLETMKEKLSSQLRDYEKNYGRDPEVNSPGGRLAYLIKQVTEKKEPNPVIIIDEYDAPLLNKLDKPELLEATRNFLQEFYQVIKDYEGNLRFAFITGITKFSQLSIFSTLNNLKKISLLPDYDAICGITENELQTQLLPYLEIFAQKNEITVEQAFNKMLEYYDGYHFSDGETRVFNPFSLINALYDKKLNYYWFDSGTPTFLINQLKRFNTNLAELENEKLPASLLDMPATELTNAIPLLFQSGYLTIKGYDKDFEVYLIGIPNKEVRVGLSESLLPMVTKIDNITSNSTVINFATAIRANDLDAALEVIKAYIASIPYDVMTKEDWEDKAKCERFYQVLIFVMFGLFNRYTYIEVKSIRGRADIVMFAENTVYVLEFKVDSSAEEALKQIDEKGYAIAYQDRVKGRNVVKCGININSKLRTIDGWKIDE
ncbi:MAG: ATP-binding protein [Bacteroidales bacterium]|nr:ATP-binding protein [Bacteroidales bacterium]